MKIVLIGNCHINPIHSILSKTTNNDNIARVQWKAGNNLSEEQLALVRAADIVAPISTFTERLLSNIPEGFNGSLSPLPHIRGRQFHPDLVYVDRNDGTPLTTLFERNNSAIALYAFQHGVTEKETKKLFNSEVFRLLGFYEEHDKTRNWILHQEKLTGYRLLENEAAWTKKGGAYLHTPNHPSLSVFASISRQFAQKHNLDIIFNSPEHIIEDRAARQTIWPVYPGLAEQFGLEGSYCFKLPNSMIGAGSSAKVALNLDEYIESSFDLYRTQRAELATSDGFERIFNGIQIDDLFNATHKTRKSATIVNPYSSLESHKFWRRAIVSVKPEDVDPVVQGKFLIKKEDKVATAGSCFAQHISKALTINGFTWLQTETPPPNIDKQNADRLGYGTFSARYGNIYTARQLIQLYDRAFGPSPSDEAFWIKADNGRLIDPLRPFIIEGGFETRSAFISDLKMHIAAVKEMFLRLDVFVFTLGLTEAWARKSDGIVVPFHPGVVGAVHDPNDYEFKNFSVDEVRSDLSAIKERLFGINPRARVILTVSPVPLIATYDNNHVLTSTTYSKAVLRVAAEEAAKNDPRVAYFPSYELISSHYNGGTYFASDKREVTSQGVEHVMRLLLHHYTHRIHAIDPAEIAEAEIVCDEERLDT